MSKKDEIFNKQVHVKVTERMHEQLHQLAAEYGVPASTIVRLTIERLINGEISYSKHLEGSK